VIKIFQIWVLCWLLVACGEQSTPTSKATGLPETIFMQPIDTTKSVEEKPFFKFSHKSDNFIEGTITTKPHRLSELEIKMINIAFQKMPNDQEILPIIISEKQYPVNFTASAIQYRFSIDFIKNIPINPNEAYFLLIKACEIAPNGTLTPCHQNTIWIEFES